MSPHARPLSLVSLYPSVDRNVNKATLLTTNIAQGVNIVHLSSLPHTGENSGNLIFLAGDREDR